MKGICDKLGFINLILGSIGSFVLAKTFGVKSDYSYFSSSLRQERNWGLTIAIFLGSLIGVLIVSTILFALSSVLAKCDTIIFKLNSLEESNKKQPAGTTQEIKRKNPLDNIKMAPARYEWSCPKCGRVNQSYETTCLCGNPKG